MTKAEELITRVSKDLQKLTQLVTGNGTIEGSIMHRVKVLEDKDAEILEKINEAITRPCIYEKAIKEEVSMKEKRKILRIGDIANIIQLVVLVLLAYGMFIQ